MIYIIIAIAFASSSGLWFLLKYFFEDTLYNMMYKTADTMLTFTAFILEQFDVDVLREYTVEELLQGLPMEMLEMMNAVGMGTALKMITVAYTTRVGMNIVQSVLGIRLI